jgi:hypothetical protein
MEPVKMLAQIAKFVSPGATAGSLFTEGTCLTLLKRHA